MTGGAVRYHCQVAQGTQPLASSCRRLPSGGPDPSSFVRASHVPSLRWVAALYSRIRWASASWPVWAKAAEAKLESRGQEYIQPGDHPAAMAPFGRSSPLMASRARSAVARCAGVLPGTRPAASQARLSAICRRAVGSSGATTADAVRPAGRYFHRPDSSRSTWLPSTYRAPWATDEGMPSAAVVLDRSPTAGATSIDRGA